MKPNGVQVVIRDGALVMQVTPHDRVTDHIYDAVQEAIEAGWDAERLRREIREAWFILVDEAAKEKKLDGDRAFGQR